MKNKSKLILGLAAMLGVTAAAGTTAGFAWFTTIRTATVSLTNAHVYSDYGDLKVQYVDVANNGITGASTTITSSLAISATSQVTDISGDGKTFYKPVWAPTTGIGQPTVANSISSIANVSGKTYFVQFGLNLINSGTAQFSVYLESGSAVTGVTSSTADVAAAKATRVAVWSTDTTPVNKTVWQNDITDAAAGYKYLTTAAAGTKAYTVDGYTLATPAAGTFHAGGFTEITTAAAAVNGQVIATVAGSSTVEVIVSAWIEGTLSEADNDAVGGNVNLNFALAAI